VNDLVGLSVKECDIWVITRVGIMLLYRDDGSLLAPFTYSRDLENESRLACRGSNLGLYTHLQPIGLLGVCLTSANKSSSIRDAYSSCMTYELLVSRRGRRLGGLWPSVRWIPLEDPECTTRLCAEHYNPGENKEIRLRCVTC